MLTRRKQRDKVSKNFEELKVSVFQYYEIVPVADFFFSLKTKHRNSVLNISSINFFKFFILFLLEMLKRNFYGGVHAELFSLFNASIKFLKFMDVKYKILYVTNGCDTSCRHVWCL